MADLEIFIPWRDSGCPYRLRNFNYVYKYYENIGNARAVDSTHDEFNRSNARNLCVELSKSEILLIVDADTVVPKNQISTAVRIALADRKLVYPYSSIHFLNNTASIRLMDDFRSFSPSGNEYVFKSPDQVIIPNSGGAYVVVKSQWEEMGGMSEEFIGWGGEDSEFNARYFLKFGRPKYIQGNLYSLYHPLDRQISEENTKLLQEMQKKINNKI